MKNMVLLSRKGVDVEMLRYVVTGVAFGFGFAIGYGGVSFLYKCVRGLVRVVRRG